MATPPTYPATQSIVGGTGTRSFPAVTTQAGDWLVVELIFEVSSSVTAPTMSPLTWTQRTDTGQTGAGDARVRQFTAQDTTGGSRTIQVVPGSTANHRAQLTVVRGSAGPGTGTGASPNGQAVSVTRQGANSGIFMAVGDWNAGVIGTPVWTPGGATIASQRQTGVCTYVFGRWNDSGAAGTASHGISTPAYVAPSVGVIEMLGAGGASPSSATLTPASATFSAPAVSPVPQPVTVALTPATATFSARPVTPVGTGPASATLTPATATFSAPSVTPLPQPVSTAVTPATATFSARPVAPSAWLTLAPATASFSARPVTPAPGPVAVAVVPAAASFSAPAVTPSGTGASAGSATLVPATATFSARTVTAMPGPVTVALVPATAPFSARPVVPAPGPVTVVLGRAMATFMAPGVDSDSAAVKSLATMTAVHRHAGRAGAGPARPDTMGTDPAGTRPMSGTDQPAAILGR